jgi:hypothetical protein
MEVRSLQPPAVNARYAGRAPTNSNVVKARRAAVDAAQKAAVAAAAQAQAPRKPLPPPRPKDWRTPGYPPPPKGGKRRTRKSASNKKRKTRRQK